MSASTLEALPDKWESARERYAETVERNATVPLPERTWASPPTVEQCIADVRASLPTVIRDRRPTREEVEGAMVEGVSRWLHSWLADGRHHIELIDYRPGDERVTQQTYYRGNILRHQLDPSNLGKPAPGEIWRPIGPDGAGLRIP